MCKQKNTYCKYYNSKNAEEYRAINRTYREKLYSDYKIACKVVDTNVLDYDIVVEYITGNDVMDVYSLLVNVTDLGASQIALIIDENLLEFGFAVSEYNIAIFKKPTNLS